jgi:hypothetical protein
VSGTITIVVDEDSTVTGEWSLASNANEVGPQDGTGTLEGRISADGFLSIDLNPTSADNDVFLQWTQGDSSLDTGTWSWSTLMGATNEGTFTARFR